MNQDEFRPVALSHFTSMRDHLVEVARVWHDNGLPDDTLWAETWPFDHDLDEQIAEFNHAIESLESIIDRPEAFKRFAQLNPDTMKGLTIEQCESIEAYAQHYSGGLHVLLKRTADGKYLKLHDTWGPGEDGDGPIILHCYDVESEEDDETEWCGNFNTGKDAIAAFLAYPEGSEVTA